MVLSYKYRNLGILFLRLGVGLSFAIIYGWEKITAGPELWGKIGSSMGNLGINFAPEFWGFMSAFAEFGCAILLIIGLFTRPAAFLMAFNMMVALVFHFSRLDPWNVIAYPLQMFIVFSSLIFIGAGKFSLDYYLTSKSKISVKHSPKRTDENSVKHMEWPKLVEESAEIHHDKE